MKAVHVVVLGTLVGSHAAGFTSHNTAARRTTQFESFGPASPTFNSDSYTGLAKDRADAIQGGAPFPDYLYACGDEHDAGEEAHWTPFQMAAADYIRATYPDWETQGRDEDGAGLVAFMLGVTSHYIADINWHGLETVPAAEGLIRSMGFADFNCSDGDLCQIAHSAADTGGEFAAASMLNLTWYPEGLWYIPTDDLVAIYAMLNASGEGPLVEPEWINECAVIFYAGSWALSTFGELVYPVLAPYLGSTLLEQYLDFHLGGIDDDAAWTGFMQNRFADWVSNGPPKEPPNYEILNKGDRSVTGGEGVARKADGRLQRRLVQSLKSVLRDGASVVTARRSQSKRGTYVGMPDIMEDHSDVVLSKVADAVIYDYAVPLLLEVGGDAAVEAAGPDLEIVRKNVNTRINRLLSGQILQEETRHSSAESTEADVEGEYSTVLQKLYQGQQPHEYFGHSGTVADFSGSGTSCDVLVGSYGAGRPGAPQEGSARILFGAACAVEGGVVREVENTLLFRGGNYRGSEDIPSYERFGWSSAALDLNGDSSMDAVICAPSFGGRNDSAVVGNYSGRCDIFLGPFQAAAGDENPPTPSLSIFGDKTWGTFGDVLTTGDVNGDGIDDLIISAPGAGSYTDIAFDEHGELSNQGAVYLFFADTLKSFIDASTASLNAAEAADKLLQPTGSYGWYGKSLLVSPGIGDIPPMLHVGAPTYHLSGSDMSASDRNSAVGRVYMYSIGRDDAVKSLTGDGYTISITGCKHAGRTGRTLAFSKSLSAVAIAEPSFNTSTHSNRDYGNDDLGKGVLGQSGLRAGRVVVVSLSTLLASATADWQMCDIAGNQNLSVTLSGVDMEGRFGLSMAFSDNRILSTGRGSSRDTLVIGSPISRDGTGAVFGYDIEAKEATGRMNTKATFVVRGDKFDGEKKSRFGRTLLAVPNRSSNSSEISFLAAAPLADVGGSAPDGDQRGRLFFVDVEIVS